MDPIQIRDGLYVHRVTTPNDQIGIYKHNRAADVIKLSPADAIAVGLALLKAANVEAPVPHITSLPALTPDQADALQVGDVVYVRYNPHRGAIGEGVLGKIERIERGKGFQGCDLFYLTYRLRGEPAAIEEAEPFGAVNLVAADPEALEMLADAHALTAETMRHAAAYLRERSR